MKTKVLYLSAVGLCCASCSNGLSGDKKISSIKVGNEEVFNLDAMGKKNISLIGSYELGTIPQGLEKKNFYNENGSNGYFYFKISYSLPLDNSSAPHYELPDVIDFTVADNDDSSVTYDCTLKAVKKDGIYYSYSEANYNERDKTAEVITYNLIEDSKVDDKFVKGCNIYNLTFGPEIDDNEFHGKTSFVYNSTKKKYVINNFDSVVQYDPKIETKYYKGGNDDSFSITFIER